MKNKYFNEREKRFFNFFSNKDDYYKGCYFGETNPLIDNKINKIKKGILVILKGNLRKPKINMRRKIYWNLLNFMKNQQILLIKQ